MVVLAMCVQLGLFSPAGFNYGLLVMGCQLCVCQLWVVQLCVLVTVFSSVFQCVFSYICLLGVQIWAFGYVFVQLWCFQLCVSLNSYGSLVMFLQLWHFSSDVLVMFFQSCVWLCVQLRIFVVCFSYGVLVICFSDGVFSYVVFSYGCFSCGCAVMRFSFDVSVMCFQLLFVVMFLLCGLARVCQFWVCQ